jgi:steroid 5-alpha reductase family enzyme
LKSQVLIFFELQAVLIVLLSIPFLIVVPESASGYFHFGMGGGVACGRWRLAGESLADWQLKQFVRDPENKGKICQAGLWNYSRHPNYFFEWLVWVGFFVFAWDSPRGCATYMCPGLMLFFPAARHGHSADRGSFP